MNTLEQHNEEKEPDLHESDNKADTNNEAEIEEVSPATPISIVQESVKIIEDSIATINDVYDPEIEEFIKGFNDASLLVQFEPEHLEKISTTLGSNDYNTGFQAAKIYHAKEKEQEQIAEFSKLRSKSRDRENEREF